MTTTEKKMYTLRSSDKQCFEIEESVAKMSQTLKNIIDDEVCDDGIPLPNVTAKILAKVIEYCKKHAESPKTSDNHTSGSNDDDLRAWDSDFMKVDHETLFEVIMAANYLNIKGLLDLSCQTVADMIKNMSVEDVRKTFNITNDFTSEEEAEVRKENEWAFQ